MDTFKIYKNSGEKIAEGKSPLTITGIGQGVKVSAGTYQVAREVNGKESEKIALPSFTTKQAETVRTNKPTESSTVAEIKAWLTNNGIDFSGKTVKADLLALIPND